MATKAAAKLSPTQKITLEVPRGLLKQAQRASGKGISETVRSGLELVAASDVYERLLKMEGKVKFGMTWQQVKDKA